jgi:hypothetical protein
MQQYLLQTAGYAGGQEIQRRIRLGILIPSCCHPKGAMIWLRREMLSQNLCRSNIASLSLKI